ncbi:hypothetical protein JCM11251_007982 [Rhodosporidiobolus azoricus]
MAGANGAASAPSAKKRGRKIDESLPPSRSREIQRAFRARRAALLSNLEARVVFLQAENEELRRRCGLAADGPSVTGRVLVLTSVDGETPGADVGRPGGAANVGGSRKGKGKRMRDDVDDGEEERTEDGTPDEVAWGGEDAAMGAAAEVLGELGRAAASPRPFAPGTAEPAEGGLPTPPAITAGPSRRESTSAEHSGHSRRPSIAGAAPSSHSSIPPQCAPSPAHPFRNPFTAPPNRPNYAPPPLHLSQPSVSPALSPYSTLPSPALGVPPYPFPPPLQSHYTQTPHTASSGHLRQSAGQPHSSPFSLTTALTDAASHLPPDIQAQALALALAAVQSGPPEQAHALSVALMMSSAAASNASNASNASSTPASVVSHSSPHPSLPSPAPSLGLYPSSNFRTQSHTSPGAASNPSPAPAATASTPASMTAPSPAQSHLPTSHFSAASPPTSTSSDSQNQRDFLLRCVPSLPPVDQSGCCAPDPAERAKEEAKYAAFCARVVEGAAFAAQTGRLRAEAPEAEDGAVAGDETGEEQKEANKECCGGLIDCSDSSVFDSTPSYPTSTSPRPAPACGPTPDSLPSPATNDPYISLPAAFSLLTKYMSSPSSEAQSSVRRPTPNGLAEMLFDTYPVPSAAQSEPPAFLLEGGKELKVRQWKVEMTKGAVEIRRLVTEEGVEVEEARRRVFVGEGK